MLMEVVPEVEVESERYSRLALLNIWANRLLASAGAAGRLGTT
jgi:hypothetical protein